MYIDLHISGRRECGVDTEACGEYAAFEAAMGEGGDRMAQCSLRCFVENV